MSCGTCSEKTKAGASAAIGSPVATGAAAVRNARADEQPKAVESPTGKFYCQRCGKTVDGSEVFLNPFSYDGQTLWLHSPLSCCGIARPLPPGMEPTPLLDAMGALFAAMAGDTD
jgi:hypothetical protein